jgi:hypothetical protein
VGVAKVDPDIAKKGILCYTKKGSPQRVSLLSGFFFNLKFTVGGQDDKRTSKVV